MRGLSPFEGIAAGGYQTIFNGAIDAHVHLWDTGRHDDIKAIESTPSLGPAGEIAPLLAQFYASQLMGAILVQAAPSRSHSDWLRQSARSLKGVLGVVGWIDPTAADANTAAIELCNDSLVCGVRLMLHRMAQPASVVTPASLATLEKLADAEISIECIAKPNKLPIIQTLAAALPHANIVVDHCGWAPNHEGDLAKWDSEMTALAAFPNISAKFSGLIESFGPQACLSDVEDRAQRTFELFGPHRLMAASNYPICDVGGGIGRWAEIMEGLVDRLGLTAEERVALMRKNALKAYSRIDLLNGEDGPVTYN